MPKCLSGAPVLLDDAAAASSGGRCSIVCTQLLGVAAILVAERVMSERGEWPPR